MESDDDPMMSRLEQLEQALEQQQMEARMAEATKAVEQQFEETSKKYPDVPKELAEQFIASFVDSDPITRSRLPSRRRRSGGRDSTGTREGQARTARDRRTGLKG
jgi:CRP-like cAMP-binding protein